MAPGVKIVLHLTPLPDVPGEPPPMTRLKAVLKRLLRSHGWRCVHAALLEGEAQDLADVLEEVPALAEAGTPTGAGPQSHAVEMEGLGTD